VDADLKSYYYGTQIAPILHETRIAPILHETRIARIVHETRIARIVHETRVARMSTRRGSRGLTNGTRIARIGQRDADRAD
jgi:hypothetical protein